MTEIHVLIQGIIMFVSSTVYGVSDRNTGGAIAVHASPHVGKYDVMLPEHKAKLFIPIDRVAISTPPLTETEGTSYVIALDGARVQIGNYSSRGCGQTGGAGPAGDLSKMNVPDVPRLTAVTRIRDDSRPTQTGIYSGIDPNRVSAWLNMSGGTLDVVPTATPTQAEFRPKTQITYTPVAAVKWTTNPITSPCVTITPFRGGSPTVVRLTADPLIEMRFENLPVPAPQGHSHGRLGASYDFELLYDLLDAQPVIPPIPHHLLPDPAAGETPFLKECFQTCITQSAGHAPTGDSVSGLNCGPGNNSDPGHPKP
jgi:hypothetical protein